MMGHGSPSWQVGLVMPTVGENLTASGILYCGDLYLIAGRSPTSTQKTSVKVQSNSKDGQSKTVAN